MANPKTPAIGGISKVVKSTKTRARGKSAQTKRQEWTNEVETKGGGKSIRSIVEHNLLRSVKTEKAAPYGGSVAVIPGRQRFKPLVLQNVS